MQIRTFHSFHGTWIELQPNRRKNWRKRRRRRHYAGEREARLITFFTSMSRTYLRRDKHALVGGEGRGAALWSPPGSWRVPPSEILRETPATFKAFGRNLPKALRLLTQVEGLHPKEPNHWYLGYLGTRCDSQGQGIGISAVTAPRPSTWRAATPFP